MRTSRRQDDADAEDEEGCEDENNERKDDVAWAEAPPEPSPAPASSAPGNSAVAVARARAAPAHFRSHGLVAMGSEAMPCKGRGRRSTTSSTRAPRARDGPTRLTTASPPWDETTAQAPETSVKPSFEASARPPRAARSAHLSRAARCTSGLQATRTRAHTIAARVPPLRRRCCKGRSVDQGHSQSHLREGRPATGAPGARRWPTRRPDA